MIIVTGSGNAFVDGTYFHNTDTSGVLRKFEFDRDAPPALDDLSSIPVPVNDNMSQAQMAGAITEAINGAGFGVVATQDGNRVRLAGDKLVDLSTSPPGLEKDFQNEFDRGQLIEVVLGGASFTDGDTFQITRAQGAAITFEFDEGWYVNLSANDYKRVDGPANVHRHRERLGRRVRIR